MKQVANKKGGQIMNLRESSYRNQVVIINNSKNGLIFNTVNGMDGCDTGEILGRKKPRIRLK